MAKLKNAPGLDVGGKHVPVSNLDKVLYPKAGFTKGQVIDYYIRAAPVLLPHLAGRPLTLKRYPNGVEQEFFYEKKCPAHRPEWVSTTSVWSDRNQANINYCVVSDLATLVWAANLADLELHTCLARGEDIMRPTMMVFDLDPGAPAGILECAQVGIWVRELFESLGLKSFVKTSGSKGLQVYIPLNTPVTYEQTKPLAKAVAELLERQHPKQIVSNMLKALRKGKVLVDWSQNDDHKTTVCVYSLRAKDRPMVSTPLEWDEVAAALKKKDAKKLEFTSDQALKRIEKNGDLFEPVLKLKQKLPKAASLQRAA
ncbi:MAG: non-homologous end-joining DNA ligase [Verrucomicrobiae bacterium]|nr:non-homologous end-joining DNA ligase [Verrucomicrobiae bacterium]